MAGAPTITLRNPPPRTVWALEQAGVFRGLYHVLLGRIAPLDGVGPDQLTLPQLVQRVRQGAFTEIVMATNPTVNETRPP